MADFNKHSDPLVLVVEDEAIIRIDMAEIIAENGYEVVEAANAAAALEILRTRPEVSLLFTDINMPGKLDGMDLARLVHEHWPKVRLVITSGGVAPTKAEIPDSGRFIPKPYRPMQILEEIDRQLHKSRVASWNEGGITDG